MPEIKKDCQVLEDKLQQEIEEASARKRKLEEAIREVDAANEHLIDAAARQEIQAHKDRQQSPSAIPNEAESRSTDGNKSSR